MASIPIEAVQTVSGNQPRMRRIIEKATQTFKAGTPVQVATNGGIEVWDGTTYAFGLAGFSTEFGSSLTTLGTPKTLTYGSVPNQASAVNIPVGAPLNDGRCGLYVACDDTVFLGQVGPSQEALVTDVGKAYGMTVDSDGYWYVDKTKATVGTNTLARIVKIDPNDQATVKRGVYFVVAAASQQLPA